jgi:hypothetical protein
VSLRWQSDFGDTLIFVKDERSHCRHTPHRPHVTVHTTSSRTVIITATNAEEHRYETFVLKLPAAQCR